MDTHIFWGYLVLLLPLIVGVVLIPAYWLRDRLVPTTQQSQRLQPSLLLEPPTDGLHRRDPGLSTGVNRARRLRS